LVETTTLGGRSSNLFGREKGVKDERPGPLNCSYKASLVIRNGTKADCDGTLGEIGAFCQGGTIEDNWPLSSKIIAMPADGNHGAASTMTQPT